jgi:hypothetical protein
MEHWGGGCRLLPPFAAFCRLLRRGEWTGWTEWTEWTKMPGRRPAFRWNKVENGSSEWPWRAVGGKYARAQLHAFTAFYRLLSLVPSGSSRQPRKLSGQNSEGAETQSQAELGTNVESGENRNDAERKRARSLLKWEKVGGKRLVNPPFPAKTHLDRCKWLISRIWRG